MHPPADRAGPPPDDPDTLLIVGLGASAGGLEALEDFFSHMPAESDLAFVVVTHQHAGQPSMLAEILGRKTPMPVVQVSNPTLVEPNHVYTAKPGYDLAILNRVLRPMEPEKPGHPRMPIDSFFRSLARERKDRAIGVILSGTGSDGALGLKEIKGELGLVMVQEEASAQYAGMPHSAIATQVVDYVLPASKMPGQLLSYVKAVAPGRGRIPGEVQVVPPEALGQIFVLVRDQTGHDFSQYKASTIRRRIERRMNVRQVDTVAEYARFLHANPDEIELLFREFLIGVTSFYRDPKAWEALAGSVSELLAEKPEDYVFRAWVPGCSTGEEAYSLAILLRECMDELGRTSGVQIFATDLDEVAVDVARGARYPLGIANDVSGKRLSRFFTQEKDSYAVNKGIREMIVFAPQNVIADPPFTKLDLLCCRNLLIYLNGELQKRLLPLFHYSLKPGGLLFLGSSESVGSFGDLFAPLDKKWKIYRREEGVPGRYAADFPVGMADLHASAASARPARGVGHPAPLLDRVIDRMLLQDLVPPTVLIRERGDVVHVHGRTGLFLEPAEGPQSNANIFNMAREGLQIRLSAAIRQCVTTGHEVLHRGIHIRTNGESVSVDVRVTPLKTPEPLHGLLRVSFEDVRPVSSSDGSNGTSEAAEPMRIGELERELKHARESHQGSIEELETTNEELKSTNEELQSTNEELQSANEELATSREEMQSLNEELQTVNAELQSKVEELSDANNDMKNLLNSTNIATIFLDEELCIKRFTDQAKKVIRIIPTDIGRPIGDLVSTLHYDRLVDDAKEVLSTLVFKETEVRAEDDVHYLMRILPYRTTDNVIDGLVLTFVDVSRIKALEAEQKGLLEALRASPVSIFSQDRNLHIAWAGGALFGKQPGELVGKSDRDLFEPTEADELVKLKERVISSGKAARRRLTLTADHVPGTYELYVEPRRGPAGEVIGLSCVAIDMSEPEAEVP